MRLKAEAKEYSKKRSREAEDGLKQEKEDRVGDREKRRKLQNEDIAPDAHLRPDDVGISVCRMYVCMYVCEFGIVCTSERK
jgi:hypothetical protein